MLGAAGDCTGPCGHARQPEGDPEATKGEAEEAEATATECGRDVRVRERACGYPEEEGEGEEEALASAVHRLSQRRQRITMTRELRMFSMMATGS